MSLLNGIPKIENEEKFMENALKEDCKKQGRECNNGCNKVLCVYNPKREVKKKSDGEVWDLDA